MIGRQGPYAAEFPSPEGSAAIAECWEAACDARSQGREDRQASAAIDAQFRRRFRHQVEGAPDLAVITLALFRQHQLASLLPEQRNAKPLLEGLDVTGDGGMVDIHLLASASNAA